MMSRLGFGGVGLGTLMGVLAIGVGEFSSTVMHLAARGWHGVFSCDSVSYLSWVVGDGAWEDMQDDAQTSGLE